MSNGQPLGETFGSPERECGEVFYGWAPRGQWSLDFSVPRRCDKPAAHAGDHDWQAGHDRHQYEPPTPEKRARMRRKAEARRAKAGAELARAAMGGA